MRQEVDTPTTDRVGDAMTLSRQMQMPSGSRFLTLAVKSSHSFLVLFCHWLFIHLLGAVLGGSGRVHFRAKKKSQLFGLAFLSTASFFPFLDQYSLQWHGLEIEKRHFLSPLCPVHNVLHRHNSSGVKFLQHLDQK